MNIFSELSKPYLIVLQALVEHGKLINKESCKLIFHNMVEYLAAVEKELKLDLPSTYIDWDSVKVTQFHIEADNTALTVAFKATFFTDTIDTEGGIDKMDEVSEGLAINLNRVTSRYNVVSGLPPSIQFGWENLENTLKAEKSLITSTIFFIVTKHKD